MSSSERKYFGTDGIRGIANVAPLDPETLVLLGKAIAKYFVAKGGRHKILIGKDTRLSGYMIESSLAAGITSMGADVLLVGPLPTPGVAYLTKSMRAAAGVMISASHNPFQDNGIKIFGSDGYKLDDSIEEEIESLLLSEDLVSDSSKIGKASRVDDALGRYTVQLKSSFPRELSLEGIRVGFDCANGAGYIVAPQTFSELGAEVVSRGTSPNGKNINAGFGSLYPQIVSELVSEKNLDVGIALDGDADRAIFVDEKGSIHDGDVILALCAIDYKKRGLLKQDTVVSTIMSNIGLEKMLSAYDINVKRVQVGDRYVLEAMREGDFVLGGEQSGHTIFGDDSTTGDGILSALKVLEVMARSKKSLSELTSEFIKYPQELINIAVTKKPELSSLSEVKEVIKIKEDLLKDNGRVLVRYSGTENKARVMVECEDPSMCKKHAEEIAEVIERVIGEV